MAKSPRLHEVSKALGVTSKILMNELSQAGFEFKTHMAALEGEAYQFVLKKHPQLEKALAEFEKEKASKPVVKKKASKKKKSTMVTQRTQAAGEIKTRKKEEEDQTPQVEIVTEKGGETVEQKRIEGGIIRRRRVETPVEPEAPPAPQPEEVLVEEVSRPEEEVAELPSPVESAPIEEPVAEIVEEPAPQAPEETKAEISTSEVIEVERPETTSSRNLSAPRRLKIVGQATTPIPPQSAPRMAPKTATPSAEVAKSKTEADERAEKAAAEKKKAAKNWTAPKMNKRQLLGMTEEVEISRPMGRRSKKQQRTERKATKITTPSQQKRKIKIEAEITVAELADRMAIKAADVVRKLIQMGQMVSAHQLIDFDTAALIASEYGYEIEDVSQTAEDLLKADSLLGAEDQAGVDTTRAPIVTIMGHVDHGKTSLLDFIRNSRVAAGEAGGITQHIGAYQVNKNGRLITFLDTPGHQAFTKMRARGAEVTDIVILVVAADEGPKPQTLEALAHAKASKVPIIVALNKCDKPEANPEKVMQEMAGHELVPEAWGGDTMFVKVSAHTGQGVEDLLESILLQSEVLELKAQVQKPGRGVVIESLLDKGKGPLATVLVLDGELELGQPVVSGSAFGKIRAMFNDHGEAVKKVGPSTPVEVLGFGAVPEVGDSVHAVTEESIARKASDLTFQAKKAEELRKKQRISLEEMYEKMKSGEVNELRVVLKGDVQGSVEAIHDSLLSIKHDEVRVNVIYKAVGGITESDVSLAAASGALVIGFNVRPAGQAKSAAQQEGIQIKTYSVIYELIDDVKMAMQGLLQPDIKENILGQAEVREVFHLSKVGPIAGCMVKSGKIVRNALARLVRDNVVIYETPIQSVRRFKDDAKEVAEGFECGIRLENYSDMKPGDVIECFEKVEIQKAVS